MNILFIGDIIGKPGRYAVSQLLPEIFKKYDIELCIANGENLANGRGATKETVDKLYSYGVDVITSGNHIWDQKDFVPYLDEDTRILRPANYPAGVPGLGSIVVQSKNGINVGVINIQGRVYLLPIDCPFKASIKEIEKLKTETNIIIVDIHGEATAEKIAIGWYLDGKVSAVIGTHTHVQTADERILPQGTAYITDVGMTGPFDSVIGSDIDNSIKKFLYQMPTKYNVAKGNIYLCGAVVTVNNENGKAEKIERLQIKA